MDIEFDSPEQKKMVEEFFDLMGRIRNRQSRLKQLDMTEQKYKDLKRKQEEDEKRRQQQQNKQSEGSVQGG